MQAAVHRVAGALATVEATTGAARTSVLGAVISSGGLLIVPSRGVAGAQSLLVTLANGDVYVGYLVGADPRSGLAVVRINGAGDLQTVTLSRSPVLEPSLALALWWPGHESIVIGMIRDTHSTVRIAGTAVIGAMTGVFAPSHCPNGSALLSSAGAIDGIVVGHAKSAAVVAPAWLASIVARDIVSEGRVAHGWLGVRGVTDPLAPGGVRIVSIAKGSALRRDGVRPGDVIVAFGPVHIRSIEDLQARLYGLHAGERVTLSVDENGVMRRRSVTLAATANP